MTQLVFRPATADDLPTIIKMIADDQLGQAREDASVPLDRCYLDAFAAIARDPNQLLMVAEQAREVVGCLQITFIPGVSRRGTWRGQIESVRVARQTRGRDRDSDVRMGDCGVPPPRLQADPALHRQEPQGRPPLL